VEKLQKERGHADVETPTTTWKRVQPFSYQQRPFGWTEVLRPHQLNREALLIILNGQEDPHSGGGDPISEL